MKGSFRFSVLVISLLLLGGGALVRGQVATPTPQKGKLATTPAVSSMAGVPEGTAAPQVVTILHRLSGLKMLGLLVRSDERLRAITELDDAFKLMGDVHTNVIAGLAIDDGRTIVVRLPEVEAELGSPLLPWAPKLPLPPAWPSPSAPRVDTHPHATEREFVGAPNLTVIARGGKKFAARYIGFDGVTGLSILKLDEPDVLPTAEAKAEAVKVGQRLRVFAPEPAAAHVAGGRVTVKVGETEGTITKVTSAPTGALSRVKIKSARLSQATIGGIATNVSGETIGIIDNIDQGEAVVLATAQIRNAARRVLERQASVPRPWLGVRGEPIGTLTISSLLNNGWQHSEALALTQDQQGILLTSVAPDSPASEAALRPGDVILRMNGEDIRNAEDFSWLMEQAGPGAAVTLTVMHPGRRNSESVNLRLSGSFFPGLAARMPNRDTSQFKKRLFQKHGIETVRLTPGVALAFGASDGLLVFSVENDSAAFKAGLRPGDVIEAIDGQKVSAGTIKFATTPGTPITFEVVRRKQKFTFTLQDPSQ